MGRFIWCIAAPVSAGETPSCLGDRLTNIIDTILKATIIVGVTLASTSIGYYYLVYLPQKDANIETARRKEAADERARVQAMENERQAREKAAQEDKNRRDVAAANEARLRKLRIETRYDSCVRNSEVSYSTDWDSYCKRRSTRAKTSLQQCLTNGFSKQADCQRLWADQIQDSDCTLPSSIADGLGETMKTAKSRCLQEMQAGLE